MRHCYSLLSYLLTPFVLLRLWWRGKKAPQYRQRIAERFGYIELDAQSNSKPLLWLHAVSVGETMAAKPLIDELLQRYPGFRVLVTTTTPTGSAQLRRLYPDQVEHCYFPYDLPHVVSRFLSRVQPTLLIVMETELWPNLYHQCATRKIPLLLANARLSSKSLRGYKKISRLIVPTLSKLNYLAAQSDVDLERFLSLGANKEQSGVCGNLKYQLTIPQASLDLAAELRARVGERPVWVAASTHAGEDEIVLAAHKKLLKNHPTALLLLVPRHPERFEEVASLCQASGMSYVRRTAARMPASADVVWLIDSMGELLAMYGISDFSFIGGSMVPTGGHNPLEAAAFGVASVMGPHTFNFSAVTQTMLSAQAIVQVDSVAELESTLEQWMTSSSIRSEIGAAARQVLDDNLGAVSCLLEQVEKLVPKT